MGLTLVRGDSLYDRIKRHGRFAVPRDLASSPEHFKATVKHYLHLMADGFIKKEGYRPIESDGYELRGPLPHIEFSEDASTDLGPVGSPDPRDIEAMQRWERAEKARVATVVGEGVGDLVDYQLVITLERRLPGSMRTLSHSFLPQRQPRG